MKKLALYLIPFFVLSNFVIAAPKPRFGFSSNAREHFEEKRRINFATGEDGVLAAGKGVGFGLYEMSGLNLAELGDICSLYRNGIRKKPLDRAFELGMLTPRVGYNVASGIANTIGYGAASVGISCGTLIGGPQMPPIFLILQTAKAIGQYCESTVEMGVHMATRQPLKKALLPSLWNAIQNGDLAQVQEHLEREPELAKAVDTGHNNLLHLAMRQRNQELIEFLFKYDKTLATQKNRENRTPLENTIVQNEGLKNEMEEELITDFANQVYLAQKKYNLNLLLPGESTIETEEEALQSANMAPAATRIQNPLNSSAGEVVNLASQPAENSKSNLVTGDLTLRKQLFSHLALSGISADEAVKKLVKINKRYNP